MGEEEETGDGGGQGADLGKPPLGDRAQGGRPSNAENGEGWEVMIPGKVIRRERKV